MKNIKRKIYWAAVAIAATACLWPVNASGAVKVYLFYHPWIPIWITW